MLEKLRQLGWSEYEAKVYIALLRTQAATGYRAAKEAGVPSAKVYEALSRLVERGAIYALPSTGEAVQYAPIPPDELISGVRMRQVRLLEELNRELTALFVPAKSAPISEWLHGRAPVLGRINALLASAQKSVALLLPLGAEDAFQAELESLQKRHVRLERSPALPDARTASAFALVVDSNEALVGAFGSATEDAATEAFATRAPVLVKIYSDYIRLCRMASFAPDVWTRFSQNESWLGWEEAKQRRLLQRIPATKANRTVS